MYSRVKSAVCHGMNGLSVEIETHISKGLPYYSIVGLPSAIIKESKERVRAAMKSSGEAYPDDRITQSLFPAYEKKEGSQLDLPLAVGIYTAMNEIDTGDVVFLGELSLDGEIKPIKNFLSLVLTEGFSEHAVFVAPECNRREADILAGEEFTIYYYSRLDLLFRDLKEGLIPIPRVKRQEPRTFLMERDEIPDFNEVRGQEGAIRGLEIAAVGRFHTLLYGPPGCGKTMLSSRFAGILPKPTKKETIDISRVYGDKLIGRRPVRTPHHSVTKMALIGGGSSIHLGEISKANHGVLVLDEFGEYKKDILEMLREPLENKKITIARSANVAELPADFILIATMNPCHCGRFRLGEDSFECTCSQNGIKRYYSKLSWPLVDRMGIFISLDRVGIHAEPSRSTETIRREVESAIAFGEQFSKVENRLSEEARAFVERAYGEEHITMRSMNMAVRVAESIANLEHSEVIEQAFLEEALCLNPSVCLGGLHEFL